MLTGTSEIGLQIHAIQSTPSLSIKRKQRHRPKSSWNLITKTAKCPSAFNSTKKNLQKSSLTDPSLPALLFLFLNTFPEKIRQYTLSSYQSNKTKQSKTSFTQFCFIIIKAVSLVSLICVTVFLLQKPKPKTTKKSLKKKKNASTDTETTHHGHSHSHSHHQYCQERASAAAAQRPGFTATLFSSSSYSRYHFPL